MSRDAWMRGIALVGLVAGVLPARADLHFSQAEVDRGEVFSGQPLRQRFSFTNRGPGAVHIEGLHAVCGCLTPQLEKRAYQPGESGSFVLEVNTLTQPAGSNRWRLQVRHRDGDAQKTKEIVIIAQLKREIEVAPSRLALSITGPSAHEIVVTDQRPLPLRVTHVLTGTPHVTTTVTGDGRTHRVRLEVKESLPAGAHEGSLTILTDDPGYRELRVPLSIVRREKASVSAAPASVDLTLAKGQPGSRVVLLRGPEGRAVVVEKIETDNPAVSCRWAPGPGQLATLRVGVEGKRVTDVLRGTVRVHLRSPAATVVSIPVVCTSR